MGIKKDFMDVANRKSLVAGVQKLIGFAFTCGGLLFFWNAGRNDGCSEIAQDFARSTDIFPCPAAEESEE